MLYMPPPYRPRIQTNMLCPSTMHFIILLQRTHHDPFHDNYSFHASAVISCIRIILTSFRRLTFTSLFLMFRWLTTIPVIVATHLRPSFWTLLLFDITLSCLLTFFTISLLFFFGFRIAFLFLFALYRLYNLAIVQLCACCLRQLSYNVVYKQANYPLIEYMMYNSNPGSQTLVPSSRHQSVDSSPVQYVFELKTVVQYTRSVT